MSREIKFRAWDKERKLWLSDFDGEFTSYGFPTRWGGFTQDTLPMTTEHNDIIVEQYTGLKDKNGAEIYEGDIVESYKRKQEVVFGEVMLDAGQAYFLAQAWHLVPSFSGEELTSCCKVIGNIHENPELLETK